MHKTLLTALVTATLFSAGMPVTRTAAMDASPLVHEAAIVCGGNGCNPIHTKPEQRRKFRPLGYTKPIKQSALFGHAAAT